MQSEELKPCPFCGGSDVRLRHHQAEKMSWVSCVGCGLEAPSETGVTDDEAVAYWNRRAEAALSTDAEPVAWQWRARVKGGIWDAWEDGRYGNSGVVPPSIEIEERALYAAPPAPAVAVKALEWTVGEQIEPLHKADLYTIEGQYRQGYALHKAGVPGVTWHGSLKEAKAAAQADYEARIRSVLSAQVQDVADIDKAEHFRVAMLDVESRIRSLRLKELLPGQSASETAIFLSEIADILKNARDKFSFSLPAAPAAKQGEAE